MDNLLSKKCIPCTGSIPPLTADEIQEFLPHVTGWGVLKNKKITREFKFKNFKKAMEFINRVADVAEKEGHHPDIFLYDWNKVRLELMTHAIGGLSVNDFIVAAKINEIIP